MEHGLVKDWETMEKILDKVLLQLSKYPEEYNWSINILMDQIKNVVGVVVYILQLLQHFQELVEYIPQLFHNGARVMEYIPQLHEKIKQILQVLGE